MHPYQRLQWTIGFSLIIWLPVALGMLGDRIALAPGALYYVGALVFAWIGTGVIEKIINNYRATQNHVMRAQREIERIERRTKRLQEEADEAQRRRATDS